MKPSRDRVETYGAKMTGRKWSLKRHINLPSVAEGLDFMAELLKPKKSRYSKRKKIKNQKQVPKNAVKTPDPTPLDVEPKTTPTLRKRSVSRVTFLSPKDVIEITPVGLQKSVRLQRDLKRKRKLEQRQDRLRPRSPDTDNAASIFDDLLPHDAAALSDSKSECSEEGDHSGPTDDQPCSPSMTPPSQHSKQADNDSEADSDDAVQPYDTTQYGLCSLVASSDEPDEPCLPDVWQKYRVSKCHKAYPMPVSKGTCDLVKQAFAMS